MQRKARMNTPPRPTLADIWREGSEEDGPSEETQREFANRIEEARDSSRTSLLLASTASYCWKYMNPWWPRPTEQRLKSLVRWVKGEGLEVTYVMRVSRRETRLDIYGNLP